MSNPLKILENLTPPLTCTSPKKGKTHFLKKQKILFPTLNNSKSVRLPLYEQPPQNFGELNSPFDMYLAKKRKDSFFKETKDFISNIK